MISELLLTISVLSLLIYGIFNKEINSLMVLTYLLAIFLFIVTSNSIQLSMLLNNDYLSLIKALLLLVTIPILSHSFKYEFTLLLTTSLIGMLLLVSSSNLLAIYLALELQSLSAYLLAAYDKDSKESTEAGLKYFVLGALASGLILFGISLIYGFTGLIDIRDIKLLDNLSTGTVLGIVFLVIGLLFKLAAVPFHGWVPDVYEGAPTHVTAFFSIVPKIALLIILIRVLNIGFYNAIDSWQPLIMITSMLSIIIGSLGALYQVKIKKFLAYSTIANVGFILMGIATGTIEGLEASIIYTIIYMITTLAIFTIVLLITKDNFKLIDLRNLSKQHRNLAFGLTILLFSTAGLPPLAGFLGKLSVFVAAINEQMYILVLVAIVMSVISTAYYIRLVQMMYFQDNIDNDLVISDTSMSKVILYVTIGIIISLLINPKGLLSFSHELIISLI